MVTHPNTNRTELHVRHDTINNSLNVTYELKDWSEVFYLNNTKDGSQHSLALYFSMWGCGQIQLHPKTSGVFYNIRFQHDRIFFPELTDHGFSQKHSVGLEDEARLLRRRVLEPDLVPDDAVDTRV